MTVQMKPVSSSNILAIGYDLATGTLQVQFHGGSTYAYSNVLPSVAQDFKRAPSVGKFFAAHIKDKYPTTKL